jgi:hypothetical protein
MQHHETAQFDSEMQSRKVMGFVIWPFTIQEKSLLLVVARHSRAADLDNIHIIARNTQLPVKSKRTLKFLIEYKFFASLKFTFFI